MSRHLLGGSSEVFTQTGETDANGKPGDHPLTDIIVHRIPSISPEVDALIWDINRFGDEELERVFRHNLRPDPLRYRQGWSRYEELEVDVKEGTTYRSNYRGP